LGIYDGQFLDGCRLGSPTYPFSDSLQGLGPSPVLSVVSLTHFLYPAPEPFTVPSNLFFFVRSLLFFLVVNAPGYPPGDSTPQFAYPSSRVVWFPIDCSHAPYRTFSSFTSLRGSALCPNPLLDSPLSYRSIHHLDLTEAVLDMLPFFRPNRTCFLWASLCFTCYPLVHRDPPTPWVHPFISTSAPPYPLHPPPHTRARFIVCHDSRPF